MCIHAHIYAALLARARAHKFECVTDAGRNMDSAKGAQNSDSEAQSVHTHNCECEKARRARKPEKRGREREREKGREEGRGEEGRGGKKGGRERPAAGQGKWSSPSVHPRHPAHCAAHGSAVLLGGAALRCSRRAPARLTVEVAWHAAAAAAAPVRCGAGSNPTEGAATRRRLRVCAAAQSGGGPAAIRPDREAARPPRRFGLSNLQTGARAALCATFRSSSCARRARAQLSRRTRLHARQPATGRSVRRAAADRGRPGPLERGSNMLIPDTMPSCHRRLPLSGCGRSFFECFSRDSRSTPTHVSSSNHTDGAPGSGTCSRITRSVRAESAFIRADISATMSSTSRAPGSSSPAGAAISSSYAPEKKVFPAILSSRGRGRKAPAPLPCTSRQGTTTQW